MNIAAFIVIAIVVFICICILAACMRMSSLKSREEEAYEPIEHVPRGWR
jgi:large-conductance mechanosensitive channel